MSAEAQASGRPRSVQEWMYLIIVSALAAYLVIGILAWTWMILAGVPAPEAFTTVLAAVVGALAGMVAPLQGPARSSSAPADDG